MKCKIRMKPPYVLTIGDERHPLTQGQYNVLMTLMRTKMCSLGMLLDAVYPPAAIRPLSERGVVYTHLYSLRQLLDGHWRIINHHRTGWYLVREKNDGTTVR